MHLHVRQCRLATDHMRPVYLDCRYKPLLSWKGRVTRMVFGKSYTVGPIVKVAKTGSRRREIRPKQTRLAGSYKTDAVFDCAGLQQRGENTIAI